jgi:hypothetical protein
LVAGEEAGDIHAANRTYDVQVWSIPAARNSLTDIKELLIDTPDGGRVQLQEVADVRIAPTPNVIEHENLKRRIDVGANVRGRDLGSVYVDVEASLAGIEFPHGYYPELLGEYTERLAVQRRMLIFSIIALIAIFLLLHTAFRSARLATLSFVLLPSALVGGVLAAYFGGGVLSLGSLVGFLTVLGIAARNGILMINHFQHLEQYEGVTFGPELVLRGARERLAPILMTATTTGLALVPLVIAGQIPGNEVEHPMAVVILGGLVTSTLVNLLVVPSLYLRYGNIRRPLLATLGGTKMQHNNGLVLPVLIIVGLSSTACGGYSDAQIADDFDPNNFDRSTVIDNEWLPLTPGTQLIYEGFTVDEDEEIHHRIVFTVTDLTKVIGGVNSVVIFERDYSDDLMVEAELAFAAQDNDGNVWHLGEYSEVYDEVEFVGGRAWLVSHLEGATAGIRMKADPQLGTPDYSQGYAPFPYNWTDRARVSEMGQTTTVPYGSFDDVLVTEEFNEEEPGAIQLKYYARGLGNVRVGWRGDDTQHETLELIDVKQLGPEEMAELRAEALALETRAYVYAQTPPAEQRPKTSGE